MVWIDNWYRRRFTTDPSHDDASLNVSVIAVLHITRIPPFPGQLHLSEIVAHLPVLARNIRQSVRSVLAGAALVASQTLTPADIRVPLDIRRTGMRSLQWRPYILTALTISSNLDLD